MVVMMKSAMILKLGILKLIQSKLQIFILSQGKLDLDLNSHLVSRPTKSFPLGTQQLKLCSMPTFNPFWNTLSMLPRFMKYFNIKLQSCSKTQKGIRCRLKTKKKMCSTFFRPIPNKSETLCLVRNLLLEIKFIMRN